MTLIKDFFSIKKKKENKVEHLEPREEMTDFEKGRKLKREKQKSWLEVGNGKSRVTIRGLLSYSYVNKQKHRCGQLIISPY